ncbi:MAG TPA: hypothetical protein VEI57_15280 [Nitrospirota bacterium]|nr:hypothetical protein [Nitrospirota bacterium]
MKKLIALAIMLSIAIPLPVRAGLTPDFEPVEQNLIDQQKQQEEQERLQKEQQQQEQQRLENQRIQQEMNKGLQQPAQLTPQQAPVAKKSGSTWWIWVLGILAVGGIAAAAGGSHGSSSSSSSSGGGSTGAVSAHW